MKSRLDYVCKQVKIKKPTILEEFKGATVLTIAHRLNTIINSDKVLFLNKGTVLEYDSPQKLMANPNSAFAKLAEEKKRKKDEKKDEKKGKK